MKKLILLFSLISVISCRDNKKENQNVVEEQYNVITNDSVADNLYYEVIIGVIVKQNDRFHLFYKDFNDDGYSSDRVIETIIKGSEINQQITFPIPEEVIPNGLRIDFGINYSQPPIILNSLKIRYNKKEFSFDDGKFEQLFRPNKFVSYNELEKKIVTEPIDGVYDPNFVSIDIGEIFFSLMD
ncbi:MAG: hypothetical protein ACK5NB_06830 [Flavobacteriaceae bacterium]